jgi:hypothetical protein
LSSLLTALSVAFLFRFSNFYRTPDDAPGKGGAR